MEEWNKQSLDLFGAFTPHEIELLWDKRKEPRSWETRRKISEARTGRIHSEETRKKMSEAQIGERNHFFGKHHTAETCRRLSEYNIGERSPFFGKPQNEEHKKKKSESYRKFWASLTNEERVETTRNSFNSDEAIRNRIESCNQRPTQPEAAVDRYLKKNFPGEYGYNGDFSLGITIGGRIPDFPNINGKKEVISVMGGFGHFHFLEDEKNEIDHYAKYGYKCHVIWEWDAYDSEELDKIFRVER